MSELEKHPDSHPDPDVVTVTDAISEKAYSVYTSGQKRAIVIAATTGAFFSPFTAQIYFPALTAIAADLRVTDAMVNLTITTYMVLQAIAPAFIGSFSDTAGRRPAYIVCFSLYIIADIALALQRNYVALLVLRMLQSAGSSGTVALVNAVVADIVPSAERGFYIGITSLSGSLAPSLGPVVGGILSQYAGWHWIFWFLLILAIAFIIPMLLFLPETCRLIVDDGSLPPPPANRCLTNYIVFKARSKKGLPPPDLALRDDLARKRGPTTFPNPFATLTIAFEKEGFLILFYGGILFAGFYAVIAGMPSQLSTIYGYNDFIIGLMYLPVAGGSILAAFLQGWVVDWAWSREARRVGVVITKGVQQDLRHFPVERARLQVGVPIVVLACISTFTYGWVLQAGVHIAVVCFCLFLQGFVLIGSMQITSILIVDINKDQAGKATAAFNLIRCLLGAGATAAVLPLTARMGTGWAYTCISMIYIIFSPTLWMIIKLGPRWREERRIRDDRREEEDHKRIENSSIDEVQSKF